jgi:hypothetical protein
LGVPYFRGWEHRSVLSAIAPRRHSNDVCYQVDTGTYLSTGDNQILTGYSGGEQGRWLEQTLFEASLDRTVDWIAASTPTRASSTW